MELALVIALLGVMMAVMALVGFGVITRETGIVVLGVAVGIAFGWAGFFPLPHFLFRTMLWGFAGVILTLMVIAAQRFGMVQLPTPWPLAMVVPAIASFAVALLSLPSYGTLRLVQYLTR